MSTEASPRTSIDPFRPNASSGTSILVVDTSNRTPRVPLDVVHAYTATRRSIRLIVRPDRSSRASVTLRTYRSARGPIRGIRRYRSSGRSVGIGRNRAARALVQALGGYRTAGTPVCDLDGGDTTPGCSVHVRTDRAARTPIEIQVRHAAAGTSRRVWYQRVPGATGSGCDRATVLGQQRNPRRTDRYAVSRTPVVSHVRHKRVPRTERRVRHQGVTRT